MYVEPFGGAVRRRERFAGQIYANFAVMPRHERSFFAHKGGAGNWARGRLACGELGTQASRLRLTSNNSDGETAGGTPASHAPAAAYGTQASRLRQADSHPAPFAPAPPYDDVWLHFNPASRIPLPLFL